MATDWLGFQAAVVKESIWEGLFNSCTMYLSLLYKADLRDLGQWLTTRDFAKDHWTCFEGVNGKLNLLELWTKTNFATSKYR